MKVPGSMRTNLAPRELTISRGGTGGGGGGLGETILVGGGTTIGGGGCTAVFGTAMVRAAGDAQSASLSRTAFIVAGRLAKSLRASPKDSSSRSCSASGKV